jgi:DNA-binding NarL/FixJ family response regulator
MSENKIRVLIVDDHPIVRKGLQATIEPEPDIEVVGAVPSAPEAIEQFRRLRPDVTLMDLHLAGAMTGVEATQQIRREFPEARIVVISAFKGDQQIYRALQAGAVTYLLKDSLGDDLTSIIRQVYAGGGPIPPEVGRKLADRINLPVLTSREEETLDLIAKGFRNKEIADQLGITEDTVQGHIKSLLVKLNVHERAAAVAVAIRRGILRIH